MVKEVLEKNQVEVWVWLDEVEASVLIELDRNGDYKILRVTSIDADCYPVSINTSVLSYKMLEEIDKAARQKMYELESHGYFEPDVEDRSYDV